MKTGVLLSWVLASGVALAGQTAPAQPAPAGQAARPGGAGQPAQAKPGTPTPPAQAKPPAAPAPAPAAPPQPGQAAPAPAPVRRPAAPAPARGGMALTVTSERGVPLAGIHVRAVGPMERVGDTSDAGQVNLPGLQAGTYRVRFSGPDVVTFEREIVVQGGRVSDADITLNMSEKPPAPAPVAAPAPPPPVAPAPPVGPIGRLQSLSMPDVLDRDFVGRQPRRESLLSCSGNTRTTLLQMNESLPERVYEGADAVYYVVGGEGTARVNGRESPLNVNAFLSVPRGTPHALERRGKRTFIVLAVLSGEPCETAR